MFQHLVESTKDKQGRKRNLLFFCGTAMVWMVMLGVAAVAGVIWYDAQLTASASTVMLAFSPPSPPAPPLARGGNQNTGNKNTSSRISALPTTPPVVEPEKITPPGELPPLLPNAGGEGESGLPVGDPHGSLFGVPGGEPGGVVNGNGKSELPPQPPTVTSEEVKPTPSVVRKSEGVLRGIATNRPVPEYPALAKMSHVGGDVVVEIVISEEGRVVTARCISGHVLLQNAALNAAREFRFRPTLLNHTPVKVTGLLTFRFTLNS
ncbi:MAG: energy transducer TonB [Blastocatellia bacterium]|nr:energy transducer TonB [Blastocatellia bacterium]